jgi:hypothetical protein
MATSLRTALSLAFVTGLFAFATTTTGCAADTANQNGATIGSEEVVGADESGDARAAESVLGNVPVGSTLKSTTGVNLRSGPSTSSSILHVVPAGATVTVVSAAPNNGFYNVKHNGVTGWSFGTYYNLVSSPSGGGGTGSGTGTSSTVAAAVDRAKSGVGFSYWWGHGRWLSSGATSSTAGSCSGSCPSCSHGGSYGADCSGYVAKIWQVPSSNSSLSTDSHPYSTGTFVSDSSLWSTVGRGSVKTADALVYNSGGSGHIFLYESGDGWGSMWAYEAKGCSYGIVHNLRTASSSYHAIRRSGW